MAFGKLSVLVSVAAVAFCAAAERAEDAFAKIEALADEKAARAAIKSEPSAAVLALLAKKSKSWRLRADAVYFIREESLRKEVFASDSDWRVRAAAVFHMVDATFVERVACDESEHECLRAVAATKVRSLDVLEKLKTSSSERVRRFAARSLPPPFDEAKVVSVPEVKVTSVPEVKAVPVPEVKAVPVPETTFTDIEKVMRK